MVSLHVTILPVVALLLCGLMRCWVESFSLLVPRTTTTTTARSERRRWYDRRRARSPPFFLFPSHYYYYRHGREEEPDSGGKGAVVPRSQQQQQQHRLYQQRQEEEEQATYSFTSGEQVRARDVFSQIDADGTGTIRSEGLYELLRTLDIEASAEEVAALFKYLDGDGDGEVGWEDFVPWYDEAFAAANDAAQNFQSFLIGRRTVDQFDQTPVDDGVLRRAVLCAINAPNRNMSEPWRFIKVGPKTVADFAALNKRIRKSMETETAATAATATTVNWEEIPGWCVVTTKLTPGDVDAEMDDFKSTSCAVQNMMLAMWSEGIGTKWTSGPVQKTKEFADLCGVDTSKERVVGCIWYGFPTGGLIGADPKRRKKGVDDVLSFLP